MGVAGEEDIEEVGLDLLDRQNVLLGVIVADED